MCLLLHERVKLFGELLRRRIEFSHGRVARVRALVHVCFRHFFTYRVISVERGFQCVHFLGRGIVPGLGEMGFEYLQAFPERIRVAARQVKSVVQPVAAARGGNILEPLLHLHNVKFHTLCCVCEFQAFRDGLPALFGMGFNFRRPLVRCNCHNEQHDQRHADAADDLLRKIEFLQH